MFIDLAAGEGVAVVFFLSLTLVAFAGAGWAASKAFRSNDDR